MAGSSPATCSAIGSAGIPEMRKRGYSGGFAAGIIAAGGTLGILLPPSITMILYAVAAEQSLGRLFLAAIGPALLLVALVRRLCDVAVPPGVPPRQGGSMAETGDEFGAAAPGHAVDARQVRAAAARAAVRHPAHRRDDRALRRLCDAVGDGGPRRGAGAGPDRGDLQRVDAARAQPDPGGDAARIHHADAHHRHVAALFLRDELPAHQPVGRAVDRRAASVALGAARRHPGDGGGARLLPAAGVDHPDDRADHPAAAARRAASI